MFGKYKIVCVTPAGRRRYMQYLAPPIINSDIVDKWEIWINTVDMCDIQFFEDIANKYNKVELVWQPNGLVCGNDTINIFYTKCCDEDTIYIKTDDDVVWMEPMLFEKIVKFRVDNPEYFLVSPLVINNPKCTYYLQVTGKLKIARYQNAENFGKVFLKSGKFAVELHSWFIKNYLSNNKYQELYIGDRPVAATRFSINCILWFGKDMAKFGGVVPGDDEEWLSCIKPSKLGLSNCIDGNAIIAHFAFGKQRPILDKAHVLEKYGEYLHQEWSKDAELSQIDNYIQNSMQSIAKNETAINSKTCPLKKVASLHPELSTSNDTLADRILPKWLSKGIRHLKHEYSRHYGFDKMIIE